MDASTGIAYTECTVTAALYDDDTQYWSLWLPELYGQLTFGVTVAYEIPSPRVRRASPKNG